MKASKLRTYFVDSIGLWGWYGFAHWASSRIYLVSTDVWWCNQFGFCGLSCIAIALCLVMAGKNRIPYRIIDWLCLACTLIGLCVLSQEDLWGMGFPLIVFSVFSVGFFMAWFVVRWASRYAAMGAKEMLIRVLLAIIMISILKMVSYGLPLFLLPLLYGMVLFALTILTKEIKPLEEPVPNSEARYSVKTILSLWQTILSIMLFFILWSFLNMTFNINVGHISRSGYSSVYLIAAAQIIDIGFSLFMLLWMFRLKRAIDWTLFWQIAYFVLAVGLLAMSLFGTTQVVQVFLSAAAELVFMFLVYFLTRLGRKSAYEPPLVMAVGYALISLIDWTVRACVSYFKFGFTDTPLVPVFLFIILFTIVFFLPARSPGMQLLTSELGETVRGENLDSERCRALAKEKGLSSREFEVLVLLCRGRSAPYIAETLYLSENTVKTYRKRIYQKLGVHDKQELLDLIDAHEK